MRDILITAFIFIILPFIFKRPYIGLLLWSWMGYMSPHRLAYGFAYSFPFIMIISLITVVSTFGSDDDKSVPLTPVTKLMGFLLFWMVITTIFSLVPQYSSIELERVVKIQAMILITLMVMKKKERIIWLVWVIVIGIGFYGVKGGLFAIATGGKHLIWGPPGSFLFGNNEIAFAFCMVLPLMRFLQINSKNILVRRGMIIAITLTVASVITSYSRGALLALSMMGLFLILKSRQRLKLIFIVFCLAVAIVNLAPEKWFSRMNTIQTYEDDGSALGRINSWYFAINLANDRPLVGGGFASFDWKLFRIYAPEPRNYHDAHSIYFEMLGEHGYVGLITFLLILWFSWRTGNWVIRETRGKEEWVWASDLAAMIQVSLIGYMTGGAFLGLAYLDLPYQLMAMLVILQYLVRKGGAAESPIKKKNILERLLDV